MLPRSHPDRIQIAFDDHRLVANAGLMLPATLARRLGLPQLADRCLDLGHAPGRANTGDKLMTLVASALAGGDCIDDADALRSGGTAGVLGRGQGPVHPGRLPAQLPVGPRPPAGPGEPGVAGPGLGCRGRSRRGYHPLLAVAAGTGDVLMARLREGQANTGRGADPGRPLPRGGGMRAALGTWEPRFPGNGGRDLLRLARAQGSRTRRFLPPEGGVHRGQAF